MITASPTYPQARGRIILLAILIVATISGCTTKQRMAPPPSTFLTDVDITQQDKNLPFEHSWVSPDVKPGMYKKALFKPVRSDLLDLTEWTKSASIAVTSQEEYVRLAAEVAKYFNQELSNELREYPEGKAIETNAAGEGVLIFEIALTELYLSHPAVSAATLAAPIPGLGAAVSAISSPHVAFAARITDGKSGKLVATVADRKFPPRRLIDLNKMTATSSAREIVSLWAELIAECLNKGRFQKTENKGAFSLLPW